MLPRMTFCHFFSALGLKKGTERDYLEVGKQGGDGFQDSNKIRAVLRVNAHSQG